VLLADYEAYADVFLAIVAVPSVVGEMSFAAWLLMVAAGRRAAPGAHPGSADFLAVTSGSAEARAGR